MQNKFWFLDGCAGSKQQHTAKWSLSHRPKSEPKPGTPDAVVWVTIKTKPSKSCANNQGSGRNRKVRTGGPEPSARWHGSWEIKPESTSCCAQPGY
jgi:hypothetical protein